MPFILNDESKKNSYGFRTSNAGIDLERFKSNPVMLDSHLGGSTDSVIGKWTNIRIQGAQLLADPEFDEQDERAMKIKGKVDRGYLKGVSMGLTFNRANMELQPDDSYLLSKCELVEASIVSIPSNSNSLKLYAETGELLDEDSVRLSIQEISNKPINPIMRKIMLSVSTLLVLGLQNTEDNATLEASIEKLATDHAALGAKLTAEKTAREAAEAKLTALDDAKALSLVESSIAEGRITAEKKEHFLSLAKNDFATAKEVLESIPAKVSLAGTVVTPGTTEVKTDEDFMKLSDEAKLAFKNDHPTEYEKMFS